MNLNLNKNTSLLDLHKVAKEAIEKANVAKAQVVAVFDVSGSMQGMYRDGTVSALATRVLAVAMQLDDNGIIPVYALYDGVKRLADLSENNLADYVANNLMDLSGGTEYAPTIDRVVADAQEGDPMLVLLFTDGDNSDHAAAKHALIEASHLPIFFQWYGIYAGRLAPSFDFLHKMDNMSGRVVDNAGFSSLGINLGNTGNTTDDAFLFQDMLKEYKDFPDNASGAGVTWANKKRKKFLGLF